MRLLIALLSLVLPLAARAQLEPELVAEPPAVPYTPITIPLAVRGPYLGTYLEGRQHKNLAKMSPNFWTGTPIGWGGLVRIDGEVWSWMGNLTTEYRPTTNASVTTDSYSSTFVMTNGPASSATVSLTATFISPQTPRDLFRQSLPFSYLTLTVTALDSNPHKVEVYSDVNGLWLSNREEEVIEWAERTERGWTANRFRLAEQRPFQEDEDRILSGDVWYAAKKHEDANADDETIVTTYSTGNSLVSTRKLFAKSGQLDNSVNITFRPTRATDRRTKEVDEPVFAFAHSFPFVDASTPLSMRTQVLAIGHVRDPLVQYMTENDTAIVMHPLWAEKFSTTTELLDFVMRDFDDVVAKSREWNYQMYQDGINVHSKSYADIMAVSTRQIWMALEGVWHPSITQPDQYGPRSPMWMLKEISSNGNCQTLDVLTPMLPYVLYAAPQLLPQLLEPIYRYVNTSQYVPIPPPHDLGEHYPNATGRNDFLYPNLPLEEAGDMLNVVLAAMMSSEEGKIQAKRYYKWLQAWAGYLVDECLYPGFQKTTDDFFPEATNQTSLAMKGIIGLYSMSEISKTLGHGSDYSYYLKIATSYKEKFLEMAVAKDHSHFLASYGAAQDTFVTQYNLYFDKLLGLNVFEQKYYDMMDSWYLGKDMGFGPPLDSRNPTRSKTDWLIWTAAASTLTFTKDMFIRAVDGYFRHDENAVFGDLITPDSGWSVGFLTRPVVGGHFALVALKKMEEQRKSWFSAGYVPALTHVTETVKQRPVAFGGLGFVFLSIGGMIGLRLLGRKIWGRRGRTTHDYSPLVGGQNDDLNSTSVTIPMHEPNTYSTSASRRKSLQY